MQHVIIRLRSNNIPFSSHGAICYPLKQPFEAVHLPWYDFRELGLVVMTYNNKLGDVKEATVDMNKIRTAMQFMSQDRICPVTGKRRKFYRFCDDNQTPFSTENMAKLRQALQHPDEASYPKDLRTLD